MKTELQLFVSFGSDLGSDYILHQTLKSCDSDREFNNLIGGDAVECKCSCNSKNVPIGKR